MINSQSISMSLKLMGIEEIKHDAVASHKFAPKKSVAYTLDRSQAQFGPD
jgi:hypothetical protein